MNDDLNLAPEPDSSINFGLLYSLVLRRSWIIGVCFVVTMTVAALYITFATPIYESTAVLEVQKTEQAIYKPDKDNSAEDTSDDTQLKTIEQALLLDSLYTEVAQSPAVVADKAFIPGLNFPASKTPTIYDIVKKLKKNTTVKLLHSTRLVNISVDHPDPATAQLLAQTIVNTFIDRNGRSQTDTDKAAMSFLEGETTRFKNDLQKAQDALQVYGQALLLKDQITDQQKVVLDLAQRYRPKHPKLIQARSELAQMESSFDSNITTVVANSPTEATYWNDHMKDLATASADERVENELKLVEARTSVLQREGQTQSALFDSVLKQMHEAAIGKEAPPVTVRVDQDAPMPDPQDPAKPQKTLLLALAGIGGIAIGLMIIFVTHGLDSSLKSVSEVESLIKLPVLGSIPTIKDTGARRRAAKKNLNGTGGLSFHRNLVLMSEPEGAAAENFRSLRAAIELLGKEKDHRVVLFASAITNEGKTFTSCNYAISLAQQGLRTLLIDADLRCPAVHERFDLSPKTMGLMEHVSLGADWNQVVQRNLVENLDILLPGVQSPNPAEFLSGDGLKEVIRHALTMYDRVVIDSPPVNVVSDTLLIVPHVQTVCLVVRCKQTPIGAVERALALLKMAKSRPVGIVFNGISTDWTSPYGMPKYFYADNKYGKSYVKTPGRG